MVSTDRRTDTEGYNIIPRHTLVAGYKKVCLLSAQNDIILSFKTDRILSTQNEIEITYYFILQRP